MYRVQYFIYLFESDGAASSFPHWQPVTRNGKSAVSLRPTSPPLTGSPTSDRPLKAHICPYVIVISHAKECQSRPSSLPPKQQLLRPAFLPSSHSSPIAISNASSLHRTPRRFFDGDQTDQDIGGSPHTCRSKHSYKPTIFQHDAHRRTRLFAMATHTS